MPDHDSLQDKMVEALEAHGGGGGVSLRELAESAKVSTYDASKALKRAQSDGSVHVEGKARGARWYVGAPAPKRQSAPLVPAKTPTKTKPKAAKPARATKPKLAPRSGNPVADALKLAVAQLNDEHARKSAALMAAIEALS